MEIKPGFAPPALRPGLLKMAHRARSSSSAVSPSAISSSPSIPSSVVPRFDTGLDDLGRSVWDDLDDLDRSVSELDSLGGSKCEARPGPVMYLAEPTLRPRGPRKVADRARSSSNSAATSSSTATNSSDAVPRKRWTWPAFSLGSTKKMLNFGHLICGASESKMRSEFDWIDSEALDPMLAETITSKMADVARSSTSAMSSSVVSHQP